MDVQTPSLTTIDYVLKELKSQEQMMKVLDKQII